MAFFQRIVALMMLMLAMTFSGIMSVSAQTLADEAKLKECFLLLDVFVSQSQVSYREATKQFFLRPNMDPQEMIVRLKYGLESVKQNLLEVVQHPERYFPQCSELSNTTVQSQAANTIKLEEQIGQITHDELLHAVEMMYVYIPRQRTYFLARRIESFTSKLAKLNTLFQETVTKAKQAVATIDKKVRSQPKISQ